MNHLHNNSFNLLPPVPLHRSNSSKTQSGPTQITDIQFPVRRCHSKTPIVTFKDYTPKEHDCGMNFGRSGNLRKESIEKIESIRSSTNIFPSEPQTKASSRIENPSKRGKLVPLNQEPRHLGFNEQIKIVDMSEFENSYQMNNSFFLEKKPFCSRLPINHYKRVALPINKHPSRNFNNNCSPLNFPKNKKLSLSFNEVVHIKRKKLVKYVSTERPDFRMTTQFKNSFKNRDDHPPYQHRPKKRSSQSRNLFDACNSVDLGYTKLKRGKTNPDRMNRNARSRCKIKWGIDSKKVSQIIFNNISNPIQRKELKNLIYGDPKK